MAYNEKLAQRIVRIFEVQGLNTLVTKKMFGGVGYLLNGNMACGVYKDFLIVRVGPEGTADALAQPHTHLFDITGRAMSGWVMVAAEGYESDPSLNTWVQKGLQFAGTLPPKS